jgi:hypothetical protein
MAGGGLGTAGGGLGTAGGGLGTVGGGLHQQAKTVQAADRSYCADGSSAVLQ